MAVTERLRILFSSPIPKVVSGVNRTRGQSPIARYRVVSKNPRRSLRAGDCTIDELDGVYVVKT